MVSGTLAGELSALSEMERNATVVVERNSVLWKLGMEGLRRLEAEKPELARTFTRLVLKGEFQLLLFMFSLLPRRNLIVLFYLFSCESGL